MTTTPPTPDPGHLPPSGDRPPDGSGAPVSSTQAGDGTAAEAEREWWQEPGLPWKHKPTRSDIACLSWLGVASIYGLIMLPLRPIMLGLAPHVLGSLGYLTGLVMTGALAATGDVWWPLVLVLGSLTAMKFDWIYWWAGKLWGHGLIEVWSGRSDRARRRNAKAVAFAQKYETLAILATYLPLPIPAGVVFAALGAAGTKLSKFLTINFVGSLVSTALYMYLGFRIGEPAVELIKNYGQYLWYVSLAIIVGMVAVLWWRSRNNTSRPAAPGL